ncbi:hypothetical protein JOC83_001076 [Bacillus iocasae]|uniref:Uncharacterized protein n=1 Tax=Priestia iocasae TaxID=2291674 RepID=A0ABS2QS30_9BACI|nr:hypothetical protein [Metabacillus iocasae]
MCTRKGEGIVEVLIEHGNDQTSEHFIDRVIDFLEEEK